MASIWAAKSDSGTIQARAMARSASTDATGADKAISTTYAPHDEIFELDPSAAAWTITTINGAEFGFEVRT